MADEIAKGEMGEAIDSEDLNDTIYEGDNGGDFIMKSEEEESQEET